MFDAVANVGLAYPTLLPAWLMPLKLAECVIDGATVPVENARAMKKIMGEC